MTEQQHVTKSEKVMKLYRDLIELESNDAKKKAGQETFQELVSDNTPWIDKLERWVVLFQLILAPTDVMDTLDTPFHFFIDNDMIREVMVCIKQGCDLKKTIEYNGI